MPNDWDYQLICSGDGGSGASPSDLTCDTWHDGGTRTTFSLSVGSGVDQLWLRLTVTDDRGNTKAVQNTVYVSGLE